MALRGEINAPGADRLLRLRLTHEQSAGLLQQSRRQRIAPLPHLMNDGDGKGELRGQGAEQLPERGHSAQRGADDDDIAASPRKVGKQAGLAHAHWRRR